MQIEREGIPLSALIFRQLLITLVTSWFCVSNKENAKNALNCLKNEDFFALIHSTLQVHFCKIAIFVKKWILLKNYFSHSIPLFLRIVPIGCQFYKLLICINVNRYLQIRWKGTTNIWNTQGFAQKNAPEDAFFLFRVSIILHAVWSSGRRYTPLPGAASRARACRLQVPNWALHRSRCHHHSNPKGKFSEVRSLEATHCRIRYRRRSFYRPKWYGIGTSVRQIHRKW